MTSCLTEPAFTDDSATTEADDPDTLRFALRIMFDCHGPAAVITYARDHNIPCGACIACGWVPMLDGECLLCELPDSDEL